jgi:signal transduction histidine kinase
LTLQQVQLLSFDLRPPILDDLGLIPALRWLLDRQAALGGFKTELIADPPAPDVPVDVRTVCFRIVQESLNNIVCHARAAWVSVCLIQDGSGLRLRVSDNGDGFLLSEVRKRASAGGLGLFAMEERANLANGSFTIESVPGSGTTVRVEFPACLRELA